MLAVADATLASLADIVAERFGLHFPAERRLDLVRGVAAAAREFDESADAFAQALTQPAPESRRVDALVDALTIGETYFFREPRSFEILTEHILPALIRERAMTTRRLCLWSAGCCTGEEAYTLAIVVDRLLPERDSWRLSILATDLNPRFLRKARRAEYGEWSFRGAPTWLRPGYFRPSGKHRHAVLPHIRRMVQFTQLNLADDSDRPADAELHGIDLILCRNVLMYFAPDALRRAVRRFGQALADGGWLSVSATEAAAQAFHPLVPAPFDGAVLYRKPGAGAPQPLAVAAAPPMAAFVALAPDEFPPPGRTAVQTPRAASAAAPTQSDALVQARGLADAGRLGDALAAVKRSLDSHKLDAGTHHLHATILAELGCDDEACAALRRALFVEPGFVLAHHALGALARRQGRHAEARRHFRNALALLQDQGPDDRLPHADGLAAGRLRALLEATLARENPA